KSKWLDQIIIAAGAKPANPVIHFSESAYNQCWCSDSGLAQAPNDRESVHARKQAIDDYDGVFVVLSEAQPVIAIAGEVGLITTHCEKVPNLRGCLGVILNNEDAADCSWHKFPHLPCLIFRA